MDARAGLEAYQRLRDDGVMLIDEGRRRARPELLIDHLRGPGHPAGQRGVRPLPD